MRGIPFSFPNLANQFVLDPGHQPYNPGQSDSVAKARLSPFTLKPWPNVVRTINALLSSPGTPHMRGATALVNNWSPVPANYLFIAGFSGKSKG